MAREDSRGMTKAPPTTSPEGRPFVDPPWNAALDAAKGASLVPAHATISGMFFLAVVSGAKARGVTLPSARERYVQFTFYPVAELARLLVEAAERFYPQRTLRLGLRALGAFAPSAFLASTLGKVTLGSTEGVHAAAAAMANAYELNLRPSRVAILDSGSNWTIVRLEDLHYFLDSHHVGVFEGTLRHAGVKGIVQIASRTPASADFLLRWE
jgi:uncharacterized protein (TIGR02265 family)